MIKIKDLSFGFPEKDLYNKVSFTIEDGDCCAFIGSSGSGKTTLAEMIIDKDKHNFDGEIEFDHDFSVGYVSQFMDSDKESSQSVFEYIAEIFIDTQRKIDDVCEKMGTADDIEPLMEEYQDLMDFFASIDGDNYESNIDKKLNLAELFVHRNLEVSKLSGGEFKLVQVIKQMLSSPSFILMDEPDAFLDFENINALKHLINSHKGTMLIITHSRYLLNHCFNKIIHLENCEIQEFKGTYMDYNLELLTTKVELQELAFKDDKEIARNEEIVERLRELATLVSDPSKGRSLNARVKILERLEKSRIKAPFINIKRPEIKLTAENVPECENVLEVENLNLAFAETLVKDGSFAMGPHDKVAIIGANGTGKTTLLRAIFENKNPAIKFAEGVKFQYLSQKQGEMLNEDNTAFEEFYDAGLRETEEILGLMESLNFERDLAHQKIGEFSGGEKNILQLGKISITKPNMILLDEPISHLDIYAQLALEEAIINYNGAVLMVSHDFYSIVNCVDYVLIIENKEIRKMSIRKFRKMIYAHHFNKDYLQYEQSKKALETKIEGLLAQNNFEKAKLLLADLKDIIQKMEN